MKMIQAKELAEFEKELGLFERKYNGIAYWQSLRSFLGFTLSSSYYCDYSEYSNNRLTDKIQRFAKNFFYGIQSEWRIRCFGHVDFVYYRAAHVHDRFYEGWDSKRDYKTIDLYGNCADNGKYEKYNLAWPAFCISLLAHLPFGRKKDREESRFLRELEIKIRERFGDSPSAEEMERLVRNCSFSYKIYSRYYRRLFTCLKPKAFVVVCYYEDRLYPAYREAEKFGIDVVEFQHGALHNHWAYCFEDQRSDNIDVPDYLLTFGEFWPEPCKLLPRTKLVPVGYPYQTAEVLKYDALRENSDKNIVVYPIIDKQFQELIVQCARLATEQGYRVYVKIHPGEETKHALRLYSILYNCDDIEIITDSSKSIYYWLSFGRHHIMASTTVCMEALAIDGNNICITTDFPHEQSQPMLDIGLARGFSTPEELMNLIHIPFSKNMGEEREKIWRPNAAKNVRDFFDMLYQKHS